MTDTDNLTRRRFLQATGGAASAAAIAGCLGDSSDDSKNTDKSGSDSKGKSDRTLKLMISTMTTMDPIKATDAASGEVIMQVFDCLTNYPNGDINVEDLLAKKHELSKDQKKYTFHLNEDAKFHNGDKVTADDVVYSFRRLAMSKNSRRASFLLGNVGVKHESKEVTYTNADGDKKSYSAAKPGTLGVKAKDDHTFELTLDSPFHATLEMLAYGAFSIVPKNIVGDIKAAEGKGKMKHKKFANDNPVGAGPFKFDKWSSNNEAKVSRFDDYYGETAKVGGVHWNITEDPSTLFNYAINGKNADMAYNTQLPTPKYDPNKVKDTKKEDGGRVTGKYGPTVNGDMMKYYSVPEIVTFYMGFNTNAVPKPVRKACAYAMDQSNLIPTAFKGRGIPAYHFTPPGIYPGGAEAYDKHAKKNYPYGYKEAKLDKAKQVMKDAGYGENKRASFTFTIYKGDQAFKDTANTLRDKLESMYIDMKIEHAEFNVLTQRGRKGNLEAYSLGWGMDYPSPETFLQLLNPPQTDTSLSAPISYLNWSGTKASKKAKNAWKSITEHASPSDKDQQARNKAFIEMEEANWDDVCFLTIDHRVSERFSYDWVDAPEFGGAGHSTQKYHGVTVGKRDK